MDARCTSFLQNQLFVDHLRYALIWYSSDQAQDFDQWLRIPIRDIRVLQQLAREHYERDALIDPGGDIQLVYDSFARLLRGLDERGESSERLILWYATLDELNPYRDGPVVQGHPASAAAVWIKTLKGWARNDMLELRLTVHDVDPLILETYLEQVYLPVQKVRTQKRQVASSWRDNEKNRSEWDNYLWRIYYEEVRTTPAGFLFFDFERMRYREWWRKVRVYMNETQQGALLDELIEELYRTDLPVRIERWTLMTLDEAFEVDVYPIFEKVARDW